MIELENCRKAGYQTPCEAERCKPCIAYGVCAVSLRFLLSISPLSALEREKCK